MNRLRAIALVLGVACGATRPPVPSPSLAAAAAPVAVAKPAEVSKPVIPDTAAGHTMAAWLDAFNSGDAARMNEFVQRYKHPMGFRIVNFREETGGFDLVAIEKSEPSSITFVVEEKASATEEIGWLRGRARRVSVGLRLTRSRCW